MTTVPLQMKIITRKWPGSQRSWQSAGQSRAGLLTIVRFWVRTRPFTQSILHASLLPLAVWNEAKNFCRYVAGMWCFAHWHEAGMWFFAHWHLLGQCLCLSTGRVLLSGLARFGQSGPMTTMPLPLGCLCLSLHAKTSCTCKYSSHTKNTERKIS